MKSRRRARLFGTLAMVFLVTISLAYLESPGKKRTPVEDPAPPVKKDVLSSKVINENRSRISTLPANGTGSPITWFGFYDQGTGAAVQGSTWTFDHGAPDPKEGWVADDLLDNEFTAFRRITPGSWAGHDNIMPAPILAGTSSVWLGFLELTLT